MTRFSVAVSIFCLQAVSLLALSTANDQLCTQGGSYRRFYPGDCNKYVECVHGRATVESCGWFHMFDEAKNGCKFHISPIGSVDCSKANNSPTEKHILAPTKATDVAVSLDDYPICTQDKTYKTYYPGNCDKYYNCDNGKATAASCGWFYRFDEKSGECKFHVLFIGSVDCSKALSPTNKPPTPTGTTTTGTTKTSPSSTTNAGTTKTSPSSTTNTGPTGKTSPTTTTTATPNSDTTTKKHSGAGSVEISIILATLCTFATILRNLH